MKGNNGIIIQRYDSTKLMNSMEISSECIQSTSKEQSTPTVRRSKRLQEKKEDVVQEPHSLEVDPPKTRPRYAHGVLQCKNCSTIWNRDDNSAINIRRCMINWILRQERPEYLQYPKKGVFLQPNIHLIGAKCSIAADSVKRETQSAELRNLSSAAGGG